MSIVVSCTGWSNRSIRLLQTPLLCRVVVAVSRSSNKNRRPAAIFGDILTWRIPRDRLSCQVEIRGGPATVMAGRSDLRVCSDAVRAER